MRKTKLPFDLFAQQHGNNGLFARFYRHPGSAILLQKQVSKTSIAKIVGVTRLTIQVRVPHLASHILGTILRRLRSDWQRKYDIAPCLAETFVERERFAGICYRAANWRRVGQTCGRSRHDRDHTVQVPVKDIYLYPLCNDFKERLCA